MKCIDFHAHAVTPAFRQAMTDLGIDPIKEDGFPLPAWSVEDHLAFMSDAGIDYSILSAPVPHIYNGDKEKAREAAKAINDELAAITSKHSDRLGFVGVVPLPDVEAAIAETARDMDELGAAGMKVATNMGGVYLGDPLFDPLMEEWNKRGTLVIIHPCRARQRPENVITGKVSAIYEYPADTTRAVLNMIANRIMTRFPNIRWVVPHCGAFLPYMLSRFSGVSGILSSMGMMETVDAKAEFANLYFDIAGDPEPVQLAQLRMVADESHIVYGSDFPHSPAQIVLKKKRQLDENPEMKRIYQDNAVALLQFGEKSI
ncbi:amidohydrolase [Lactobacillus nasalidis]|uniref:6-methylsalicylate decarboxylase n=1 Tax=Lactobacillus nasalidis TaxID=2797258 RepID=A0ABQ3W6N7_9LACO|nr:amidohydrolase family protein [Lactobacillus nasalidis]GHV97809.1 amidohydrolase [Lactobacillus nasalidis]GHV99764.1 amidohydrolase [Lactobacillus nasalidis]GHW02208.1 amidohydrolase [Lactobacillus nasalidis]